MADVLTKLINLEAMVVYLVTKVDTTARGSVISILERQNLEESSSLVSTEVDQPLSELFN